MPSHEQEGHDTIADPAAAPAASLPKPLWPPGTLVAETYEVVGELGRGAMGVVLLAMDRALERNVALKVIRPERLRPGFKARFAAEARAMASVNHQNVVQIYAFGEHESLPYFVMQLVEGETLRQWMAREPVAERTDKALSILDDLCRGVAALHAAGTVHRDIKPSNVLLDAKLHARVADFGVSTTARGDSISRATFAGTPAYMAPEVAFSHGENGVVTPSADVYSVACVAYEILTGRLPVEGRSAFAFMAQHAVGDVIPPSLLRPDLSTAFDAVLLNGLAKNPAQRTTSVDALREGLVEAQKMSSEPRSILVAEDDDDFREALGIKLRMEFPLTEVTCVSDGSAALRASRRLPLSVAILDLQMPEVDGLQVTRALRSRAEYADVPIVILTAAGGPNEWRLLREIGADRFLVKPIDLDDVVAIIRRLLQERRTSPATHSRVAR